MNFTSTTPTKPVSRITPQVVPGIAPLLTEIATEFKQNAVVNVVNASQGRPFILDKIAAVHKLCRDQRKSELLMDYGHTQGEHALLSAIIQSEELRYKARLGLKNIAVVPGGRVAVSIALRTISAHLSCQPDRPALQLAVPNPDYMGYGTIISNVGPGVVRHQINLSEKTNFGATARKYINYLEANPNVNALLLSLPANPTGQVLPPADLAKLIDFVAEENKKGRHLYLVLDEAYENYLWGLKDCAGYDVENISALMAFAEKQNLNDSQVMVIKAATKGLVMPGERVAWVEGPEYLMDTFRNISSSDLGGTCREAQQFVSLVLPMAGPITSTIHTEFGHNHQLLKRKLRQLGFEIVQPKIHGSFYQLAKAPSWYAVDGVDLFFRLLTESGIAVAPLCFFTGDDKLFSNAAQTLLAGAAWLRGNPTKPILEADRPKMDHGLWFRIAFAQSRQEMGNLLSALPNVRSKYRYVPLKRTFGAEREVFTQ